MRVSVAMVTYNHEEFIAKALDSVLMQKTDFEYEIVIGEDCSTDKTRNIVLEYKRRYPDKIVLFLNEENLGMHGNGLQVFRACKGEYIAILEGDDYWTSPDKLQKQVVFLDKHSECMICFHNAMVLYNDKSYEAHAYCNPDQKTVSTAEDLLKYGNFIPSCSKMYRKKFFEIPDWVSLLKMGDWPCDILLSRYGDIGYINEIMSVYVIHKGGVWYAMRANWEETSKANIGVYEKMYDVLPFRYKKLIRRILHGCCVDNAEKYEAMGERDKAKKYVLKAFADHYVVSKRWFKTGFKLSAPRAFNVLKTLKQLAYS